MKLGAQVMTTREEVTLARKRTLAIRAAHFCSNPRCLKLTAGPHSDQNKSLSTGHAAHIHAASPKGPRYDTDQTRAQRRSILTGLLQDERVYADAIDPRGKVSYEWADEFNQTKAEMFLVETIIGSPAKYTPQSIREARHHLVVKRELSHAGVS
jgi:hypothetical protein